MIGIGLGISPSLGALVYPSEAGTASAALSPFATAASGTFTFDPSSISGLISWYRADKLVSLNSTTVSAWGNSSGLGDTNQNALQGTAGSQPLFVAASSDFNNQPTISFGSNKSLQTGVWSSALVQPVTIFIVARSISNTTNQYFLSSLDAATTPFGLFSNSSGQMNFACNVGTANTGVSTGTTKFGGIFRIHGNTSKFNISQTTTQNWTNPGTGGATGLTIGNFSGALVLGNVEIADIAHYNKDLSQTEIDNLNTYINTRYAITIGA